MAHSYFADQLTLFQPGGTDYALLITTGTPGFSNLPTALHFNEYTEMNERLSRELIEENVLKLLNQYYVNILQKV
jgi:hypothetical protein